jgi:hypothetical protein
MKNGEVGRKVVQGGCAALHQVRQGVGTRAGRGIGSNGIWAKHWKGEYGRKM